MKILKWLLVMRNTYLSQNPSWYDDKGIIQNIDLDSLEP